MKAVLKRFARALGYHVGRLPNRFDAMAEALGAVRARGFAPDLIIDAGANVGRWSLLADQIFGPVDIHLIEPQPACHTALGSLCAGRPRWHTHAVAIGPPGRDALSMRGSGADSTSEGAWVTPDGTGDLMVPAATLDALCADLVQSARRVLLKLDLEGYELPALAGASRVLPRVEVLVTEVRFYDIGHSQGTVFDELFAHLHERGFRFYDLARLAARPRDNRPALGDVVFVRQDSELMADVAWH